MWKKQCDSISSFLSRRSTSTSLRHIACSGGWIFSLQLILVELKEGLVLLCNLHHEHAFILLAQLALSLLDHLLANEAHLTEREQSHVALVGRQHARWTGHRQVRVAAAGRCVSNTTIAAQQHTRRGWGRSVRCVVTVISLAIFALGRNVGSNVICCQSWRVYRTGRELQAVMVKYIWIQSRWSGYKTPSFRRWRLKRAVYRIEFKTSL